VRYHRHIVGVVFDDSTGGATVRRLLRKYQATIVGGLPNWGARGAYVLQVPDTVTTYEGLQGVLHQIGNEIGVDFAFGETWRDKVVFRGAAGLRRPGGRPDSAHQLVIVRGRVVEAESRAPVTNARVEVPGLGAVSVNSTGRFEAGIPRASGCVRLRVRAVGYLPTERTVDLAPAPSIALGDIPLRWTPILEGPTLLIMSCRPADPGGSEWGTDTVRVN
jgi:hypothetical protein